MRFKLVTTGLLSLPLILSGCTSSVKSPKEPLEQKQITQYQKEQEQAQKPATDYDKAAKLYVELGLAYLNDGMVGRAKTKLLRAKKLAPELPEVHYALGYYMESVGEFDQASAHYQNAIKRNPTGGAEHNNYGAFLCRQGYYRQSEKEFLKATQDPQYANTAEAFENAGLCVLQIPDVAKAKDYFLKAVRMDPRRNEALIELSYIYFNEKHYSKALEFHSLFADQAQHTPRSLWLGVQLAKHYNDLNKVASYTMLLKNRFPNSQENQIIQKENS